MYQSNTKSQTIQTDQNQTGLVSIMVTIIIMIVLSLIVIGFAKLTRREQRQALDRQLSTQAFYAAESGINDAVSILKTNPTAAKTSCTNQGPYASLSNQLDGSSIAYTCLLVDPSPSTLVYDSIDTNTDATIPISASGNLSGLTLSWQDTDGGSNFDNCPVTGNFPPVSGAGTWPNSGCDAGVLRVELVPSNGTLSRSGLLSGTLTAFLYPVSGSTSATTLAYGSAVGNTAGLVVASNCNNSSTPRLCNVTITGLGGTNYYLRLRSIYKANSIMITPIGASGSVTLSGAQALIDSTGKAGDVLRRIVVRLDVSTAGTGVPSFAIQSRDTICKRFATLPNSAPIIDSTDPACLLN